MALDGGPLVEMLNYCTATKFEGFEAAESEYEIIYLQIVYISERRHFKVPCTYIEWLGYWTIS